MLVETEEVVAPRPTFKVREAPRRWAPESWPEANKFAAIVLQLGLLLVLIKRFNLESPAFFQLSALAFAGFAVHYFLPLTYRLPFFLVLSLTGIVMVLGVTEGAWLLGIGLVLIGLCHAPALFWARVTVLAMIGIVLALMRAGMMPTFVPMAIWPILGSMFVFRLVVYMHDLRYQTAPFSLTQSLSYFFLLPNVCFPLFPVVDYQSFCRNYYDEDRYKIYQVGVRWIFRGVVHLLIYRMLYSEWSIDIYDVANAGDLVHYCLWLFLLYLRVSGQFHIIVGMLHLFGFNLAETHHLYYLSSSFTDFWRRINIYWKDFMMKIFFYPAYFRLKSRGPIVALVASTLVVFVLTWALHAVQWFWLRGSFLWAANDVLFWSILAGLVVVNSIWEVKRGRKRVTLGTMSWPAALTIGLKTLATFTVICSLWSMWSTESLTAWLTLWNSALVAPTASGWLLIAAAITAIVGSAALVARNPNGFAWNRFSFFRESAVRMVLMLGLAALSANTLTRHLGAAGRMIADNKQGMLNKSDMQMMERGYYENLLSVDRFNGELWSLYSKRPRDWTETVLDAGLATPTNNILRYEMKPNAVGQHRGAILRTNRWGMHDKDYAVERPPGCFRIAILGASQAMGLGVETDETFEARLEDRLNKENAAPNSSYEILNFSVTGYRPIRQIWVLQDKALKFSPNMVMFVGHHGDADRIVYEFIRAVRDGVELPDPYLRELAKCADINPETPEPLMQRRLKPFAEEFLNWVFGRIVGICKEHQIQPVYLLFPIAPGQKDNPAETGPDLEFAAKAGFTVVDLSDAYDGHDWRSLWLSEWDTHPNVLGHQLLAKRIYERLIENQAIPISRTDQKPTPASEKTPAAQASH